MPYSRICSLKVNDGGLHVGGLGFEALIDGLGYDYCLPGGGLKREEVLAFYHARRLGKRVEDLNKYHRPTYEGAL